MDVCKLNANAITYDVNLELRRVSIVDFLIYISTLLNVMVFDRNDA